MAAEDTIDPDGGRGATSWSFRSITSAQFIVEIPPTRSAATFGVFSMYKYRLLTKDKIIESGVPLQTVARKCGLSLEMLSRMGFTAAELRDAGLGGAAFALSSKKTKMRTLKGNWAVFKDTWEIQDVVEGHFTPAEMAEMGMTMKDLFAIGLTRESFGQFPDSAPHEWAEFGMKFSDTSKLDITVEDFIALGWSADQVIASWNIEGHKAVELRSRFLSLARGNDDGERDFTRTRSYTNRHNHNDGDDDAPLFPTPVDPVTTTTGAASRRKTRRTRHERHGGGSGFLSDDNGGNGRESDASAAHTDRDVPTRSLLVS